MTRSASFYFDSQSCSGCKACQIACKDKHGLEVGRLWRRVYEVNGGSGWQVSGQGWQADVAVYNLSIACNHCANPICVEVCPTKAMHQRSDGIVLVDDEKCIGCQYCSMACPYGAPQYDPASRAMTKCTFCYDNLEAGLAPACVAACPLRSLEYKSQGEVFALEHNHRSVLPLPPAEITEPALWINPHPAAIRLSTRPERVSPRVVNQEEVGTNQAHDFSLAVFTTLAPLWVGMFLWLGLAYFWMEGQSGRTAATDLLSSIFLWLSAGMVGVLLVSLLHLGRPSRAIRAIANMHTSWLSREVWFAGLFTAGFILFAGLIRLGREPYPEALFSLAAASGLALVYCIGRVYRLRSVPSWDSAVTQLSPALTCLALGGLGTGLVLVGLPAGQDYPALTQMGVALALLGWLGLAANLVLAWWETRRQELLPPSLMQVALPSNQRTRWLQVRLGLTLACAVSLSLAVGSDQFHTGWLLLALALGLITELAGRVLFYRSRPI